MTELTTQQNSEKRTVILREHNLQAHVRWTLRLRMTDQTLAQAPGYSFIHLFVCLFVHLLFNSAIYPFICLFVYTCTCIVS